MKVIVPGILGILREAPRRTHYDTLPAIGAGLTRIPPDHEPVGACGSTNRLCISDAYDNE